MYRLQNFGLGSITQQQYLDSCEGPNPNCAIGDAPCIANWQDLVNACENQFATDPLSPHNNSQNPALPGRLIPGTANYQTQLAAAGGSAPNASIQVANTAVSSGYGTPWMETPKYAGVTPYAGFVAAPAPTQGTKAAPASPVYQSSAPAPTAPPPYQSSPGTAAPPLDNGSTPPPTGFSLTAIPWWGWAIAAGVGFLAMRR